MRSPLLESMANYDTIATSLATAYSSCLGVILSYPWVRDESGNQFVGHTIKNITSRRVGRLAFSNIPPKPSS